MTIDDEDMPSTPSHLEESEVPLTVICDHNNTLTEKPVKEEREKWGNKAEFLLATIGLAVGLGNIWRFPYLCQKNGGGAFLIPFLIFIVIEGIPLFFIELGVGQRFRKTAVEVWRRIHKSLTGIGISCMIVSSLLCMYYIIVISWCVYYAFLSMASELPWQKKNCEGYNTYMHYIGLKQAGMKSNVFNTTAMPEYVTTTQANMTTTQGLLATTSQSMLTNHTGGNAGNRTQLSWVNQTWLAQINKKIADHKTCCIQDPPTFQWYEKTLKVSTGIGDSGIGINTNLLCTLVLSWLIVYICIVKGIKSSGKAVYFTATFPYLILFVLFIKGITLPGASDGIKALFTPDFKLLLKPEIWKDAATQVFFSLSLGFGALIAFASYNPINNNIVRDAYIIVFTDVFTALFGGVVVFSVLGYRQHVTGVSVAEGNSGAGLAFVTFSDVLLLMEVSPLWAILFFLMLVLLGIDSEFGTLEGVIAPLYDLKLVKMKKFLFLPIVIGVMFLVDLSMIAGFGYYVFQIFDSYAVNIPLLVIAFMQCIAIGWVYGTDKFADDIEFMTGRRPWKCWMFCWKYLSPIGLLAILIWILIETIQKEPVYTVYVGCYDTPEGMKWTKDVPYPAWARCIAALMVIGTLLPIPIFIVKEWPSNWKHAFKKRFCSGIANYMPDPAAWRHR